MCWLLVQGRLDCELLLGLRDWGWVIIAAMGSGSSPGITALNVSFPTIQL